MNAPLRCRGIALLMVLWALTLLSVIGASFALAVRTETQLVSHQLDRARAGALADGGLERGIAELLAAREDTSWRADGSEYAFELDGAKVRVRIFSEGGKIDINTAPAALVQGLIAAVDAEADAAALGAAIEDWRDADSLVRVNGAEDRDYRAAGLAWGAGDAPFRSIEELQLVLGMTPELFERLAGAVTVDSGVGTIDPLTAPRLVLLALPGVTEERVDEFLAARAAASGRRPAVSLGAIPDGTRYLASAEAPVYTVTAEAILPGGGRGRRQAIVRITNSTQRPYLTIARGPAPREEPAAGAASEPSDDEKR